MTIDSLHAKHKIWQNAIYIGKCQKSHFACKLLKPILGVEI